MIKQSIYALQWQTIYLVVLLRWSHMTRWCFPKWLWWRMRRRIRRDSGYGHWDTMSVTSSESRILELCLEIRNNAYSLLIVQVDQTTNMPIAILRVLNALLLEILQFKFMICDIKQLLPLQKPIFLCTSVKPQNIN